MGTLHEDRYTIFITSRSVLLRMRNVSEIVVEKIKTHILCSITFFFSENCAFYEIMWKNSAQLGRPQTTIWRMRTACWIPKAKNTHIQFV
jgi:HKD family nuclease